ncbi:hypothetical protein GQ457_11G022340 [Hibiscus cannabinus]
MEANANACEDHVDTNNFLALRSQYVSKRRSMVWKHSSCFDSTQTKDGKERALCKCCKAASFYLAYIIEPPLCKNILKNLISKAIIKHEYGFSWVEHEAKVEETKVLWLDVPTRWNSTYMMLDRAILNREAFTQMDYDKEETMILDYTKTYLDNQLLALEVEF